jgi:hypothetical protein
MMMMAQPDSMKVDEAERRRRLSTNVDSCTRDATSPQKKQPEAGTSPSGKVPPDENPSKSYLIFKHQLSTVFLELEYEYS